MYINGVTLDWTTPSPSQEQVSPPYTIPFTGTGIPQIPPPYSSPISIRTPLIEELLGDQSLKLKNARILSSRLKVL